MNLNAPRRIITSGAMAPSARYSPIASSWPARPARCGRKTPPVDRRPKRRRIAPGKIDQRRQQVDERDAGGDAGGREAAGARDDERHAARAFEEAHLVPEAALAEHFAVVAGEDDDRVLGEPARAQAPA